MDTEKIKTVDGPREQGVLDGARVTLADRLAARGRAAVLASRKRRDDERNAVRVAGARGAEGTPLFDVAAHGQADLIDLLRK